MSVDEAFGGAAGEAEDVLQVAVRKGAVGDGGHAGQDEHRVGGDARESIVFNGRQVRRQPQGVLRAGGQPAGVYGFWAVHDRFKIIQAAARGRGVPAQEQAAHAEGILRPGQDRAGNYPLIGGVDADVSDQVHDLALPERHLVRRDFGGADQHVVPRARFGCDRRPELTATRQAEDHVLRAVPCPGGRGDAQAAVREDGAA